MKRITKKIYSSFTCRKCDGNFGEAVEQEEKLCDEVKVVRKLDYHGDRVRLL